MTNENVKDAIKLYRFDRKQIAVKNIRRIY